MKKTDLYSKHYWMVEKAKRYAASRLDAVGRITVMNELDAIEQLLRKVDSKEILVEFGIGGGAIGFQLIDGLHIQEFIGCDTSRQMLKIAKENIRKNHPKVRNRTNLILGDINHLPLREKCTNLAISIRLISHISNKGKALQEVRRTLKEQGALVFDYYNRFSVLALSKILSRRTGDFTVTERIRKYLKNANLSIIQIHSRFLLGHVIFEKAPTKMLRALSYIDKTISGIFLLRDFAARKFILAKIPKEILDSK